MEDIEAIATAHFRTPHKPPPHPGLVDVVHRDRSASSCPPDGWRPQPAGGMHPNCFSHWWPISWPGFWLRPGDVHFSQDHCHPLILHPAALQWSERAERASIQQNKQTNKSKCRGMPQPLEHGIRL